MRDFLAKVRMISSVNRSFLLPLAGVCLLLAFFLLPGSPIGSAQPQNANPTGARGVIRLRVRLKSGSSQRGLARKRFFLIRGSSEANRELIKKIEQQPVVSRDCYYQGIGASKPLISWLKENDCESVYCREVETKDVEGAGAVPEFQQAIEAGEKQFGSREIARKWVSVNLSEELRSGFYRKQQATLQTLIKEAEQLSKAKVISVMTDRLGTAYFTDLEPGDYLMSNVIPTEFGEQTELWNCDMKVKPGDLATEKPFQISNSKDKNVKCVSQERPLPACPAK